ncbi:TPA: hypothetical protein EYP83_01130, partial [Candidatus Geothermarchaeota archaeon]|nr:hypothetical protein [Candidatus Geothermarchaeota archaeon]
MDEYQDIHDLIRNKLWSLIHDPAEKAWYIKEHEVLARKNIIELDLPGELAGLKRERSLWIVDGVASSVDRQLLGLFYLFDLGSRIRSPEDKYVFKNIFDTDIEENIPLDNEVIKNVNEEVNQALRSLLKNVYEALNKYGFEQKYEDFLRDLLSLHILYFYHELLWILNLGPNPVADTRVPTHTVFDHNSATATVSNWFTSKGEFRGYMVRIDLGGIHKYISNSRKLRDLWVSSYIASGLIWMALSPLIFILGPDIVLTPSLRMNPVYGYTLNTWLNKLFRNIGLDADLRNWMKKYLNKGSKSDRIYRLGLKYIQDLKNPPDYSIQPGIFTLALPPRKIVEDVINLFRELHNKYRDKFFLTGYP